MTAQIVMVVWDTVENDRTKYTKTTLRDLVKTVDFNRHRLFISDNGSCDETLAFYKEFTKQFAVHGPLENLCIKFNGENIGTSKALNFGLINRKDGEACIKIDGDVLIYALGWVDRLCEVVERDAIYGIVGLKRKDLAQSPNTDNLTFKSELVMLPHESGQRWIIVEVANDIMGTCTLFSPALMDKIGLSSQPGLYGFEDVLYGLRSRLSGFKNCFLPSIVIDHIDDGQSEYTQEKQQWAAEKWEEYMKWHTEYCNGERSVYYGGE